MGHVAWEGRGWLEKLLVDLCAKGWTETHQTNFLYPLPLYEDRENWKRIEFDFKSTLAICRLLLDFVNNLHFIRVNFFLPQNIGIVSFNNNFHLYRSRALYSQFLFNFLPIYYIYIVLKWWISPTLWMCGNEIERNTKCSLLNPPTISLPLWIQFSPGQ